MSEADRIRWNRRYRQGRRAAAGRLATLAELDPLLAIHVGRPSAPAAPACALDLACGLGRNALYLAEVGYRVTAVDVADEALRSLEIEAVRRGLDVRTLRADLDGFRPSPASCDLVVETYFLDRRLWPAMAAALRPGGMIFVETFTVDWRCRSDRCVPRTHLLERGELATAFLGLEVLFYREQVDAGIATLLACDPRLDERVRRLAARLRSTSRSGQER